jgi:hypothetical protein
MPKTHRDGTVSHAALGLVAVPPSVLAFALHNQVHAADRAAEAGEGEQPSAGINSSESEPSSDSSASGNARGSRRRAPTTGSPSSRRRRAPSSAPSTDGSTPATGIPAPEEADSVVDL